MTLLPEIAIRDEVQQVSVWGLFYLWYIDLHTFTHSFAIKKYKKIEIYEMLFLVFHEEMMVVIVTEKNYISRCWLCTCIFFLQFMKLLYLYESIKTNFIV